MSDNGTYVVGRGTDGHLWEFNSASSGWTSADLTAAAKTSYPIASDPRIASDSTIWAVSSSGHIIRILSDDHPDDLHQPQDLTGSLNYPPVTGDASPATTTNEEVLAREPNGDLQSISSAGGGWVLNDLTAQQNGLPAIASDPYMDPTRAVYTRNKNNNDLMQYFVNSSSQWVSVDITAAITATSGTAGLTVDGNPSTDNTVTYCRNAAGHLIQFFVRNGQWVDFDVSAAIASRGGTAPTLVGNPTTFNGQEYSRTADGRLFEFYVGNSQWTALDVTPTGFVSTGDPVATARGLLITGNFQ